MAFRRTVGPCYSVILAYLFCLVVEGPEGQIAISSNGGGQWVAGLGCSTALSIRKAGITLDCRVSTRFNTTLSDG